VLPPIAPEPPPSASPESPAAKAPKSSLDGVAADDLTEDSPLTESRDPDFPEDTGPGAPPAQPEASVAPKQATPDESAGAVGEMDEVDEPPTSKSPKTNLKTLEDNADLI